MFRFTARFVLITVVLFAGAHSFAADPPEVVLLQSKGLVKSGNFYVLKDEVKLLDEMKTLRATKKDSDTDMRARHLVLSKMNANKNALKANQKEWDGLNDRLSLATNTPTHNRIVLRMNQLTIKIKSEREQEEEDAKEGKNLGPSTAEFKFMDDSAKLQPKADAINDTYAKIGDDAALKAAINKVNWTATPKVALGPSPEFVAAAADLKQWNSQVDAQAIPLQEDNGVQVADVLVNGESVKMIVDSGASTIMLTPAAATKLKIVPTAKTPLVELTMADGHTAMGYIMTLKSVRVGKFTVENVECAVLQGGTDKAQSLLGGTFLSHFIVKLDEKGGELHLSEVKDPDAKPTSTPTGKIEVGDKPKSP